MPSDRATLINDVPGQERSSSRRAGPPRRGAGAVEIIIVILP